MSNADRDAVRDYYDTLAEGEWGRLESDSASRVSFEIHRRFLRRHIQPGMHVLEIGAGPGRFTIELAQLGATILVTDYSAVQLELNRRTVGPTSAEQAVVERRQVDVCDTSEFATGEFDAVLAYGGALSYAFEQVEDATKGLLRIVKPDGVLVASVMSMLGTWRYLLSPVTEFAATHGEELNNAIFATGDLRLRGGGHVCMMFRSDDIVKLVHTAGGSLIDASASNWASMNPDSVVESLEADPVRWEHFLNNEQSACACRGAWDGGTHMLFAATPT